MNHVPQSKLRRVVYWIFFIVVLAMLILAVWAKYFYNSDSSSSQEIDQKVEDSADENKGEPLSDEDEDMEGEAQTPGGNNEEGTSDDTSSTHIDSSLEQNADTGTDYESVEGGNFDDRSQ